MNVFNEFISLFGANLAQLSAAALHVCSGSVGVSDRQAERWKVGAAQEPAQFQDLTINMPGWQLKHLCFSLVISRESFLLSAADGRKRHF